jgi:ATP/maltotriose-dependent transcriptional regulator MalT
VKRVRSPQGGSFLERGRAAYVRRAWAEACEALAAADAEAQLDVEDLELLASAAGLCGRVSDHLRHMERLYEGRLVDEDELGAARAAIWLGMRLYSLGERARASGWLARGDRLAEGRDCVERGYLLLSVVRRHEVSGDHVAAEAAAAEAQAIGDRFRDADLSAFARSIRGAALVKLGRTREGLALLDEAMVAATSGGLSPTITGLTYCTAIASCQRVYALERGREWTLALTSWCESQPQLVPFAGRCLVHRAEILQLGGAWGESIEDARRAAERRSPSDDKDALGDAFYQEAEIHRLRGELAEAEQSYRRASEVGREAQPGLALLWLRQGRGEAAVAAISRVLAASHEPLPRAQFLPAMVEIRLATGAVADGDAAARELEAIAARFGTDVLGAMAADARGAVEVAGGRAEAALEPLRRALRVWQQLDAPYLAARARVLIARACDALGDQETAKLERELARQVFERLGAASDVAALDGAPAPPARGPDGLTARELQVLRLVATGKTNKTIAKELFLSEKTVDRHVSNIFTKVNVASRAAATAYAYQHRLV